MEGSFFIWTPALNAPRPKPQGQRTYRVSYFFLSSSMSIVFYSISLCLASAQRTDHEVQHLSSVGTSFVLDISRTSTVKRWTRYPVGTWQPDEPLQLPVIFSIQLLNQFLIWITSQKIVLTSGKRRLEYIFSRQRERKEEESWMLFRPISNYHGHGRR